MFNVQCAMSDYNVQCAYEMCDERCAMCDMYCAVCVTMSDVQCAPLSVPLLLSLSPSPFFSLSLRCALCAVQRAMCHVHCAMCNVH
jgi:hypothetical protein